MKEADPAELNRKGDYLQQMREEERARYRD
jgi:hypothetical protein